jgi:hypothetical protein
MLMLFCSIWNSKTQNSPVTSDVFSEGIAIGAGHNALVESVKKSTLNILESNKCFMPTLISRH